MKQLRIIFVALITIAFATMGCKQNTTTTNNDSIIVDSVDTLAVDSIVYHASKDSTISSDIVVDFPQGSDSISIGVRSFIADKLAKLYLPLSCNPEASSKYKTYNGDIAKAQAIVDYYGKGTLDYMISEQEETIKLMNETESEEFTPSIPRMNNELNIRKSYENDKYITYHITNYCYLGGAHGSALDYSVNISKATGKALTETVDTMKTKAIQPLLRKGVLSYIRKYDKEVNEKNLLSFLFIENGIIPLPANAPYLAEDGIHFAYQQYEIGPYAMGIIEFTIPYADIKPYLCKETLDLF